MFDAKAEIAMPAPARLGGTEIVTVRWPSDEEWAVRSRARKYITRRLGRGRSETVPPEPGEPDQKLYDAIALNGSPQLTPAEASMVLEAIGMCLVTNVEVEGNEACVSLNVVTGAVQHRLKVPTAEQILQFRRGSYKLFDLPYGQQEIRFNPESGARLWDQCEGKGESYTGPVPGPHKAEAMRAVVDFIEHRLGPASDDPNS
jgi:hypothetical protein